MKQKVRYTLYEYIDDFKRRSFLKIRILICNNSFVPREPEVAAVLEWIDANRFVLSASFHDG
jgi:hypothetical protein